MSLSCCNKDINNESKFQETKGVTQYPNNFNINLTFANLYIPRVNIDFFFMVTDDLIREETDAITAYQTRP